MRQRTARDRRRRLGALAALAFLAVPASAVLASAAPAALATPAPPAASEPAASPAESGAPAAPAAPASPAASATPGTDAMPTGPGPSCAPGEPGLPASPAPSAAPVVLDKTLYRVGEEVTATSGGFGPGEVVRAAMYSGPLDLGTFTANEQGEVTATFVVPEGTNSGNHPLRLIGTCEQTAAATILIGADGTAGLAGTQAVPVWAWWGVGLIALVMLAVAAWRLLQAMRETDDPNGAAL